MAMDFEAQIRRQLAALPSAASHVDLAVPRKFPYEALGVGSIEDSTWMGFATWLNGNCSARKEPQFFGVEG